MGMVKSAVVGGGIGIVTGGATGYCFARVTEKTLISRGDLLELGPGLNSVRKAATIVGVASGGVTGGTVATIDAMQYRN